MEQLPNGYCLEIPAGAFPLSTDSMLLAHFIRLPKQATVLDLGSGCGTLGVLLCAKDANCRVTGIELDENAHHAALHNIDQNGLNGRLESICGDLRQAHTFIPSGKFHCCISNPPYFSGGAASRTLPTARQDDCCTTQQLFSTAAQSLRYGGDFYLVHKPEKLATLISTAIASGLEPKRLCSVYHHPGSNISLILLACRKGAKPGLSWETLYLFDETGNPTPEYRQIYHLQEA